MFRKFVDREFERSFLEERCGTGEFEFIVVYGRRRQGKTELIKNFIVDKSHLYFLCDKAGTERNARRFKAAVAGYLDEQEIESTDLREIFTHLAKRTAGKRLIVAMDEFSYLVEKDGAIPSIFQAIADEVLKRTDVFLILSGSSVSMMERGVLSRKSALYGRKTGHIRLGPLPFSAFAEFYPGNDLVENIEFHAAVGGVPFYMERFSDDRSAIENIREQVLERTGHLYEEVDFLLREEMREPDMYKGILSAIAEGNTKLSGIADRTGIRVQDMDKYLKMLNRLGLVAKERPATEMRGKRSLYCIDDNFVSTFFRFAEPFKSDLEIGMTKAADKKLARDFNSHVGRTFERLVREEVVPKTELITNAPIGRWWGHKRDAETGERRELEIDIVTIDESARTILFGECKWKEDVNGQRLLEELKEKAEFVTLKSPKGWKERYILVARTFKKRPDESEVRCLDLEDISELLGGAKSR
ncbi:MAG: ATP-binding protein [Candidatus Thermoplasmatota archaeon]|nr:ATP-binding protein [Euryarchaeota archaeon]MBU4032534.1 ATP-binding protein [Candidatus Thermoplasmatota archaeon]MBU4070626.1 ATP-binding protein [Candidatus Thermoplasmatota archaeon]MBU4145033.1 ATP-binding protein [Candidatus Thermoplasmatota archaeon]MBU4590952.1 ATP-binding protein [Candidatus Thermoplasmatota archaeon]